MPRTVDDSQSSASLITHVQTAWGTRDGADDDDGSRMIRVDRKQQEAGNGFSVPETSSYQNEKCEYRLSFPHSTAL